MLFLCYNRCASALCASHYAPLFSVLLRGHWSYNYWLFHGGSSWSMCIILIKRFFKNIKEGQADLPRADTLFFLDVLKKKCQLFNKSSYDIATWTMIKWLCWSSRFCSLTDSTTLAFSFSLQHHNRLLPARDDIINSEDSIKQPISPIFTSHATIHPTHAINKKQKRISQTSLRFANTIFFPLSESPFSSFRHFLSFYVGLSCNKEGWGFYTKGEFLWHFTICDSSSTPK